MPCTEGRCRCAECDNFLAVVVEIDDVLWCYASREVTIRSRRVRTDTRRLRLFFLRVRSQLFAQMAGQKNDPGAISASLGDRQLLFRLQKLIRSVLKWISGQRVAA